MKRGDRVAWYVWTGGETQGKVYGTVARVNGTTVTVRPDGGDGTIRIHPDELAPILADEEPADELQDRANREALAADAEDASVGREPSRMASYPAPRAGEAFTQTLQRRQAKSTARIAREAVQAEKDRVRRELETLAHVRACARGWKVGELSDADLALEIWMSTIGREEES